nr:MAG TPA: hypothetical protein [Caudoviricetes sp.]
MIEDKYIVFAHVKGNEYPMCMTIKALSVLEGTYGSVDNIFGVAKEATKTNHVMDLVKTTLAVASVLADAGRDYVREMAATSNDKKFQNGVQSLPDFPVAAELEKSMTWAECRALWNDCVTAIVRGSGREVEAEPDNSAKNAESAM